MRRYLSALSVSIGHCADMVTPSRLGNIHTQEIALRVQKILGMLLMMGIYSELAGQMVNDVVTWDSSCFRCLHQTGPVIRLLIRTRKHDRLIPRTYEKFEPTNNPVTVSPSDGGRHCKLKGSSSTSR